MLTVLTIMFVEIDEDFPPSSVHPIYCGDHGDDDDDDDRQESVKLENGIL